ncbi:unnamed protein product [Dracunculus medinensis]|uniref:Phosphotransferase n=1 Tax=Dracunculus medinensis TaxID=318479 RepID=A0A0N4UFB7_DRAME|nr:unnamed protein product [Dracunculus medinensis]
MQILEDIGIEDASVADCVHVAYVCSLVSKRAAYLCAAGIATILKRMSKPYVTIGVDGSLYRFHPKVPRLIDRKIDELLPPDLEYQLMLSADGSGRGAALVAAVATRIKQELQNTLLHEVPSIPGSVEVVDGDALEFHH